MYTINAILLCNNEVFNVLKVTMNIFNETDYKEVLKERLKYINSTRASRKLSSRSLASKINIQHTYFSRVMNNDNAHFNEDQLFEIAHTLEFNNEEIDFLMLLRSKAISSSQARLNILQKKIDFIKHNHKLKAEEGKFNESNLDKDIKFLLDPYSIIFLTAFSIEEYAQKPKKLSVQLGLSLEKTKEIIFKLSELGLVEFDAETFIVTKANIPHLHYSTDHPLMRAHQQLMRSLCSAQILKIKDEDKKSFMVTFGADENAVKMIRAKFLTFLSEIEPLVVEAKSENAYQLTFDLFKWC